MFKLINFTGNARRREKSHFDGSGKSYKTENYNSQCIVKKNINRAEK